jgi:hypothetical protein
MTGSRRHPATLLNRSYDGPLVPPNSLKVIISLHVRDFSVNIPGRGASSAAPTTHIRTFGCHCKKCPASEYLDLLKANHIVQRCSLKEITSFYGGSARIVAWTDCVFVNTRQIGALAVSSTPQDHATDKKNSLNVLGYDVSWSMYQISSMLYRLD